MVEVYFYLPVRHVENAVQCGIKLSEWYSREIELDGAVRKCITALLNPRDDMEKYDSLEFKCIKMEINPKYCYIADGLLYQVGLSNPEVMEIYLRSVIPAEKYTFGLFRVPECLVTGTVIGENVKILDKRLDSPILFNNSDELYMGNIIENYKEKHGNFNDALLYSFFLRLSDYGIFRMITDKSGGLAVFIDNRDNKVYTIRIPDLEKY